MLDILRRAGAEARFVLASDAAVRAVTILLLLDAVFVTGHLLHVAADYFGMGGALAGRDFRISRDGSYGEWYEYGKLTFCALALFALHRRAGQAVYALLAFVYLWLLADNGLSLHESAGDALAPFVGVPAGILGVAAEDVGELAFLAGVGLAILALAAAALAASAPVHRARGALCLALVYALAIFGVGFDLLHAVLKGTALSGAVGLIEDAGELVVLSFNCAAAAALLAGAQEARRAWRLGQRTSSLRERDEPALVLVPERQADAAEAFAERQA